MNDTKKTFKTKMRISSFRGSNSYIQKQISRQKNVSQVQKTTKMLTF